MSIRANVRWAVMGVLIWVGLFWFPSNVRAEMDQASGLLGYASALMDEGDFFRAAGEAERFLFSYPTHPLAEEAKELLNQARARMAGAGTPRIGEDPWSLSSPLAGSERRDGPRAGFLESRMIGLIRFYQKHLRTFRNPALTCPSYPCNSEYALQAVGKHGALLGAAMSVDRVWREVSHADDPPYVRGLHRSLHYDPLEWNDVWLSTRGGRP